jgi:hypothetical protein
MVAAEDLAYALHKPYFCRSSRWCVYGAENPADNPYADTGQQLG